MAVCRHSLYPLGIWILVGLIFSSSLLAKELPKFPKNLEFISDVVYGEAAGEFLTMDILKPKAPKGAMPVLIFIHGGAWTWGHRSDMYSLMSSAAQAGVFCMTISYRLLPKHPFPAQIEDAKTAVRWVHANAGLYQLDPERIGAAGYSAGAHLAALLAVSSNQNLFEPKAPQPSSKIHAAICMAGPYDLVMAYENRVNQGQEERRISETVLPELLNGTPSTAAKAYRAASPITYVSKETPPILLIQGMSDTLVLPEQAEAFYEALKSEGVEATLIKLTGGTHSDLGPEQHKAYMAMIAFLQKHLKL